MATDATLQYVFKVVDRDLKNAQALIRELNRTMGESGRAGQPLRKSLDDANKSARNASQGFRDLRRQLLTIAGIGGVLIALKRIGQASVQMARDFQISMSRIEGLVGHSRRQVQAWSKELLELGPKIGTAPNELAEGLYFVTSSGIDASKAIEVLTASAKAAVAGLGTTKDVADAVTSAVNAYADQNLTAAQATDVLTAAVKFGKIEANELAAVMGQLLPTAAALDIGFDKIAGTMAVLSLTGTNAEEAATQINNVMTAMLSISPKVIEALALVGLSQQQLRDTAAGPGGLVAVMRLLDKAFQGNLEQLRVVFPNVRAFRGVMNVLAQDVGKVNAVLDGTTNSTGAAGAAYRAVADTDAFKLQQAIIGIKTEGIALGAALLPPLAEIATAFGNVLREANEATEAVGGLKTVIDLLIAAGVIAGVSL